MKPKILLIIDDDPDDRDFFCDALKDVDGSAICHTSKSGLEAIEMLKAEDMPAPDFIFLDLNMPILSGKQCLTELKKMKKLAATQVIIYTTSQLSADSSESMHLGAMHFLTKPSRYHELCEALSNVLSGNWAMVR